MSAGGRAAWAGNSGRVKQTLVQLLFASNTKSPMASRSTVHAHVVQNKAKQLDSASYTYQELRAAYLERLQQWHPDKHHPHYSYSSNQNDDDDDDKSDPSLTAAASTDKMNSFGSTDYHDDDRRQQQRQQNNKVLFVELQEAWANYESAAKLLKRAGDGGSADANFTMFGVGCSFADSEEERKIRDAITDQACRGWFRSGLLSSDVSDNDNNNNNNNTSDDSISQKTKDLEISSMLESLRTIPLIDDSLFSEPSTIHSDASYAGTVKYKNGATTTTSRKSLVDFKPRRQSRTTSNQKSNPK